MIIKERDISNFSIEVIMSSKLLIYIKICLVIVILFYLVNFIMSSYFCRKFCWNNHNHKIFQLKNFVFKISLLYEEDLHTRIWWYREWFLCVFSRPDNIDILQQSNLWVNLWIFSYEIKFKLKYVFQVCISHIKLIISHNLFKSAYSITSK